jgi:hypothetical protein
MVDGQTSTEAEPTESKRTGTNLTYFLWLPAGKDEFGFARAQSAPLSSTAFYRIGIEQTIADHFGDRVSQLRDSSNRLAFMTPNGPTTPVDGELGLRKIHFRFSYQPNHAELVHLLGGDFLAGTAVVFSNGLYMWSFDIPAKVASSDGIDAVLETFLREDFVERHVRKVFDFAWHQAAAGGTPARYAGVMTFYQLDLLFNGVFDQNAHPHLFLGDDEDDDGEQGDGARQAYDTEHLIRSLSLCAYGNEYFPLFDQRKSYSLRRTYADDMAHINSSVDIRTVRVPSGDENALHRRELFFSRLTFAGMEQFLLVAASHGISLFRTGLDYVRTELASQHIEARQNRPSGELRRPSLANSTVTVGDLEAYHALLASKFPRLRFLENLVSGLRDASQPAREPKANGVEGAVEWHYSRATLAEAQAQFSRQVELIETDLRAIASSLATVRGELTLAELTETRKLSEIEAETPRNAVLKSIQWGRLTARLAVFAAIIAGAQLFSTIGVWVTEQAFGEGQGPPPLRWPHVVVALLWIVGIVGFVILLYFFARPRRWNVERSDDGLESDRPETHVFDYSSILKPVRAPDGAQGVMDGIRDAMINPEDLTTSLRCANYSTFREMPSSGVERIKYSLESAQSPGGVSYILHIEVDRRVGGDHVERLVSARLVLRKSAAGSSIELPGAAVHIIASCVQRLLFPSSSEGEMRAFFSSRFGWDWPPARRQQVGSS